MELPAPLRIAQAQGRLLLLWAALPWPLEACRPAEPALLLGRLADETARLPLATELPGLPPLPILSLDASDRVERAFAVTGRPLRVLHGRREVPLGRGSNLFKLAGDLGTRRGVVLSREEVRALLADPDKRHLLEESGRWAVDGALLVLGADPASADFAAWWEVLAPYRRGLACFAVEETTAPWPIGVVCLGTDTAALAAALSEVKRLVLPEPLLSPSGPPAVATSEYNIYIGHASGVVIGDQAQVIQSGGTVAQPKEPQSAASPPPAQAPRTPFQLQLIRLGTTRFEVRGLDTPMGQPRAWGRRPFTEEELRVVLRALRLQRYNSELFNSAQRDLLAKLGLLIPGEHLDPDMLTHIGEALYEALLPGEVGTAFQMALNTARSAGAMVALEVRFDEDAVDLAAYPWELLYYRRALLPSRAVELTRYISYPEAVTPLTISPPLRLLYIRSRPSDQETLADAEETAVRDALSSLEEEGLLQMETLTATRTAFLDAIEPRTAHVLHFDGHGVFARRCPACGALNYAHIEACRAKKGDQHCGQPLDRITPQGYLAFEGPDKKTDLVSSKELSTYLYNSPMRLAVLSACWSGTVSGATLFGGVAPALVQAGLPAVVATQLPIEVGAAATFAEHFYRALARFDTVPAAVNAGRSRILDTNEWYIPTLYLRSQDKEGQLFAR